MATMSNETNSMELCNNNIAPKRGRGRPRKLPINNGQSSIISSSTATISSISSSLVQNHQSDIPNAQGDQPPRQRGRPRKEIRKENEIQLKRPRGRPRLSEPKPVVPGRSRGRPRIHPLKDPNGPKRPRGRPPKPAAPKPIMQKSSRPRGRPRKDRSQEPPKRPRGRPRKIASNLVEYAYQQGDSNLAQYSFGAYPLPPQAFASQLINDNASENNSLNYYIAGVINSAEYNRPETNGQYYPPEDIDQEDASEVDYSPPETGNHQKDGPTNSDNNGSMQYDITNSGKMIPLQDTSNVLLMVAEESQLLQQESSQQQAMASEGPIKFDCVPTNMSTASEAARQVGPPRFPSIALLEPSTNNLSEPFGIKSKPVTSTEATEFVLPSSVNQAVSTSLFTTTTISGHNNLTSNMLQAVSSKPDNTNANSTTTTTTSTTNLDSTNKPKKAFDFYAKCILMKQEKEKKSKNPKRKYDKDYV